MAWVAVNKNGTEKVFENRPYREGYDDYLFYWEVYGCWSSLSLPKGSIKKLIGRELKWEDEAVELKED